MRKKEFQSIISYLFSYKRPFSIREFLSHTVLTSCFFGIVRNLFISINEYKTDNKTFYNFSTSRYGFLKSKYGFLYLT